MLGRPRVSVVVPVHDQASFLVRALSDLVEQTCEDWELVVVDDGSSDDPAAALRRFGDVLGDRATLVRWRDNRGLGAACNAGLDAARGELVAYLPADDRWTTDHLARLVAVLDADPDAVAAHARAALGRTLQPAQVVHRRTEDRWVERDELESDDLDLLFWDRLRRRGRIVEVPAATATWTQHAGQRHRTFLPSADGGINAFRARYRPARPLRFHSSESGLTDEVERYRRFRERTIEGADGPRVLLLGELAYNAERVVSLAERGAVLGGVWIADPLGFMAVGPVPFGHVEEVATSPDDRADPVAAIRRWRPDVVYALLNWRAVPLAARVRRRLGADVRFVWHFKEAPQRCIERGTWPLLAELHAAADAVVYSSAEERDWMALRLPDARDPATTHVLDGDLPPGDWFEGARAHRLGDVDGAIHTVVVGRPKGLTPDVLAAVVDAGIHLHAHGTDAGWLAAARARAPQHVHAEAPVWPDDWVRVLSRYDAGWLHLLPSGNGGDLRRANWDDLNVPARVPTLAAAGVPMIHAADGPHRTAVGRLLGGLGAGVAVDPTTPSGMIDQLTDVRALRATAERTWQSRWAFSFDDHVEGLMGILTGVHAAR